MQGIQLIKEMVYFSVLSTNWNLTALNDDCISKMKASVLLRTPVTLTGTRHGSKALLPQNDRRMEFLKMLRHRAAPARTRLAARRVDSPIISPVIQLGRDGQVRLSVFRFN